MALAARVGVDVARTQVTRALGRDALLVEQFDRAGVIGQRRMMVSALTMLGLDSMQFRYATYHDLADVIRARFINPDATLRELFARIVFNICVGNTDDHARNHAAFWDGERLSLTPAYDLCPQVRSGGTATQGMAISPDGFRRSQLAGTVRAHATYHLTRDQAQDIVDATLATIRAEWEEVDDQVGLTKVERAWRWGRQILNDYIFHDE